MEIVIYRKNTNRLYTEGELVVNGDRQTFTAEASAVMLPAGSYTLRIVKKSQRKQSLVIFRQDGKSTLWRIGIGHSYIGSLKDHIIAIGTPLIPGAVYKASRDYERLMDRFSKCTERKESMTLIISEEYCHPNQPIQHWLRDSSPKLLPA